MQSCQYGALIQCTLTIAEDQPVASDAEQPAWRTHLMQFDDSNMHDRILGFSHVLGICMVPWDYGSRSPSVAAVGDVTQMPDRNGWRFLGAASAASNTHTHTLTLTRVDICK